MIKSMTGFGASQVETEQLSVSVEIKTLNSKFSDTNMKLPSAFSSKEIEVRNMLANGLQRGKVNMLVTYASKNGVGKMQVNMPVVAAYYRALQETAQALGADTKDIFRMVMLMPDVYTGMVDASDAEQDWPTVQRAIEMAIDDCNRFREQEGRVLGEQLAQYTIRIRELLDEVERLDPRRVERVKEKLQAQVQEFVNSEHFDANRFEQELIYYIEKLDISEERVRLRNHIAYFLESLQSDDSNGKKLGFISQEMGREINTIGSKANDSELQRLVVGMKEELEKIKEQALNIL
jgi:uncharacterized protein (TIGR00255 family)